MDTKEQIIDRVVNSDFPMHTLVEAMRQLLINFCSLKDAEHITAAMFMHTVYASHKLWVEVVRDLNKRHIMPLPINENGFLDVVKDNANKSDDSTIQTMCALVKIMVNIELKQSGN